MNADVLSGSSLTTVDGGLINTLYRVTTAGGDDYALRLYVDQPDATAISRFDREAKLLAALAADLPVPRVVVADASGSRFPQPFVMYPWIDGITLNECRRAHGAAALQTLAHDLGRTLGQIASSHVRLDDGRELQRIGIADEIARAQTLLARSLARERLGAAVADRLRGTLDTDHDALIAFEPDRVLAHGDFSGRNVVVRRRDNGTWIVAGVLDWESAGVGSPLWDVGSLFRYGRRYSPEFRDEFARGYAHESADLPDNWWRFSRMLDVTRVVGILSDTRDLGDVFGDCRDVVASLI